MLKVVVLVFLLLKIRRTTIVKPSSNDEINWHGKKKKQKASKQKEASKPLDFYSKLEYYNCSL